jgi:hypothetical protein
MGTGIATQLIIAGATLSGVVLTLVTNAYLEGRRARDARELESLRLASEHAKWLRDERLKSYAGLSLAGEEVLQFIRSEMPMLIGPDGGGRREAAEVRWTELRTELRKAYNQVLLFGTDDARAIARQVWRISRNGGNDFLRDLASHPDNAAEHPGLSLQIKDVASNLGTAGDRFLEACRRDLQGG